IGNMLGFGILKAGAKTAIGKIFGDKILTRLVTKATGLYGGEFATETVTQMGQHNAEVDAGLREGPKRSFSNPADVIESFREIAPVVALQTTIMGAGVKAGMGLKTGSTRADLGRLMEDERSVEQIRRADKKAAREAEKAAQMVDLTPDMEAAPIELTPEMETPGPVEIETPDDVLAAGEQTDTAPTEGEKEAGNYKKEPVKFKGLTIKIENPVGSVRNGTDKDGNPWSVTMRFPYGYVKRSEGADGEQVDVYLGYDTRSDTAFVFDQYDLDTGKFDEHKVVLGATDLQDAEFVYDSGFSDGTGAQRRGGVTALTIDEFKTWIKDGDTKKPLAPAPGVAAPVEQGKSPAAVRAPQPPEAPAAGGFEKAIPAAKAFVRAKDGGKVTQRMLMTRFGLNEAQAKRVYDHLRSQGILTQKGYARTKLKKPRDVLDIIKEMGGIKPSGETRALDLHTIRPGVVRKNGNSEAKIREHLEELGIVERGTPDSVVYDEIGRAIRKERGRPFHPADEDLVREIEVEE
ncbi:MAG: hypothetical protein ACE5JX_23395, partial [Acidobacteriota bacterium]